MSNDLIEENLPAAAEGNKASLEKVLNALLEGPIFVPNRQQSHKLTFQPEYPSSLVSILGIKDKERTIVPIFSSVENMNQWFGNELLFKEYSGKSLFEILPEGWWICINPGQEVEKDISPWEIARLKEGQQGIKDIIEEVSHDDAVVQSMSAKPLNEEEYSDLKKKLTDFADKHDKILRMHMMLEESITTDGDKLERILVGLECSIDSGDLESLKEEASSICNLNLIGNIDSKVLAGASGNNIILGVFKSNEPFYQSKKAANSSLFARILDSFKSSR